MNIFEELGLKKNHRKENKITQLVKHFDEVVAKNKVNKNYGVQVKKDGVCAITLIRNNNPIIFSRTGKKFTNTENLCSRIKELRLEDGVYFGEMWLPKSLASLEVVSGVVNPNRISALDKSKVHIPYNLDMAFFDLISIESFILGEDPESYYVRHKHLVGNVRGYNVGVEVLTYTFADDVEDMDSIIDADIANGEEGSVIIDLNADWSAGHKGWRKMKKVRGVDYDLTCIGIEEGTGKYLGKAANLIFKWKGTKTIKCMLGKGWTHDDAAYFWTNPPIGSVFQVYALEESSKGLLRLPKVGEKRFDKDVSDV
jgi:ATP-dependent DNA ligase